MGVRYLLLLWPLLLCAQGGGSISGNVTNSVTGAGIEGATFRVCPSADAKLHCGKTEYHGVTDTAGAFRIGGLLDGPYMVFSVSAHGFLSTGSFPTVTVSGDSRLDIQMTPFASVRGRVFDPEGEPAAGVTVRLGGPPGSESVTDSNGEFVFKSVQPSSWMTLSAMPASKDRTSKDGTRIVTTYYPSVVDSAQAARIAITGVDASYDIRLQTALARAIRGVVIGVDGKPASKAQVLITRTESGPAQFVRGSPTAFPQQISGALPVDTDADGTFAFPPVIEGEWTVRANLAHLGKLDESSFNGGAANITVSTRDSDASDTQSVEIRMEQTFDVEVTADWGDSPAPKTPQGFALASLVPLDLQTDVQVAMRPASEPGQPQRFHLFPGRYFIGEGKTPTFSPAAGLYAAAALMDGRDVLGQVVELTGPASIKMIYKSNGGSVRGTVEKGASAMVVLMADATPAARVGYEGRCDASGAFSIPDLPPGEYTALAVAGDSFPYVDSLTPAFAAALARDGKRVKVEVGAAAQVELRVSVTQ